MDDTIANPIVVALMFIARCLVPLGLMLVVSHYLRKWGLIIEATNHEEQDDETEAKEIS